MSGFKPGSTLAVPSAPIDMVLHCPKCGEQHIDEPEPGPDRTDGLPGPAYMLWINPPHRSHLCHNCGHIWRPADVPTNGVAAVKTKGKEDSPIAVPSAPEPAAPGLVEAVRIFIGCAYPVTTEIDPRGYRWSQAYLDQALPIARAALSQPVPSAPEPALRLLMGLADQYAAMTGEAYSRAAQDPSLSAGMAQTERAALASALSTALSSVPPVPAARRVTQRDTPCSSLGCSWSREKGCSICGVDWIGIPAAAPAVEPSARERFLGCLRHVAELKHEPRLSIDEVMTAYDYTRGATLPASPEPATQGAAEHPAEVAMERVSRLASWLADNLSEKEWRKVRLSNAWANFEYDIRQHNNRLGRPFMPDVASPAPEPAAKGAAEPLCMCKDRPKSQCPGEWEPGCDLGANEKYVEVHTPSPEEKAAIDRTIASPAPEPAPQGASESTLSERRAAILAVEALIADYVHDYEFDSGEGCTFSPTDDQRLVIADAIHGLLADDEFLSTFAAWRRLCSRAASPAPEPLTPAAGVSDLLRRVEVALSELLEGPATRILGEVRDALKETWVIEKQGD